MKTTPLSCLAMITLFSALTGCASAPKTGPYPPTDIKTSSMIKVEEYSGDPVARVFVDQIIIAPTHDDNRLEFDHQLVSEAAKKYIRSAMGPNGIVSVTSNEDRASMNIIADISKIGWDSLEAKSIAGVDLTSKGKLDHEGKLNASWIIVEIDLTFIDKATGDYIASAAAAGVLKKESEKTVSSLSTEEAGSTVTTNTVMRAADSSDISLAIRHALEGSIERCKPQLLRRLGQEIAHTPTDR